MEILLFQLSQDPNGLLVSKEELPMLQVMSLHNQDTASVLIFVVVSDTLCPSDYKPLVARPKGSTTSLTEATETILETPGVTSISLDK